MTANPPPHPQTPPAPAKPPLRWQDASWAVHVAGLRAHEAAKASVGTPAVDLLAEYTSGGYAGPAAGDYQALAAIDQIYAATGGEVPELVMLMAVTWGQRSYSLAREAKGFLTQAKAAGLRLRGLNAEEKAAEQEALLLIAAFQATSLLEDAAHAAFHDMPLAVLKEALARVQQEMQALNPSAGIEMDAGTEEAPGKPEAGAETSSGT